MTLTDEVELAVIACYVCKKPIIGDPSELLCYGCNKYFCDDIDCPASEHELDVPFGRHDPGVHMGIDDD